MKTPFRFLPIVMLAVSSEVFAADKDDGFKPLFNGKNLDGFYIFLGKGPKNADSNQCVQIENGMLHMYRGKVNASQQPFGYISTEREFENYHLRFEYRWGTNRFGGRANVKRDAGVIYHMFGADSVWPNGVECQVQEGDVGDIFTVNTRVTTTVDATTTNMVLNLITNAAGVVRTNASSRPTFREEKAGGVPFQQGLPTTIRRVVRSKMLEHDGWNKVEVIVRGDDAIHIVNGEVNNHAGEMRHWENGEWKPLTKGKIIFQLEGAEVFYRNIEIRELDH
jgi:hypothetical protein